MRREHFIFDLHNYSDNPIELFDYCADDLDEGDAERMLIKFADMNLEVSLRVEIWDEP